MMNRLERASHVMAEHFDEYARTHFFSGLLRITCRDEIVLERCFGIEDPETNAPITARTAFTFYSLSKPFCTLGLMKLVDRGLLSLNAHPGRYVPEAAGFDERVTIWHMLHHTSGMADFAQHPSYKCFCSSNEPLDISALIRELSMLPMQFEPGQDTQYANINFALSARIIECVTKEAYAGYMQREVFDPLGMKTAVIDRPALVRPHRAIGLALQNGQLVPVGRNISWMLGGGDINGTADDVYCLNHALKHKLLLSNKRWQEILTPSPINSFGCGCSITQWHGRKRITHNGGHIGFRTLHIHLPDEDFDIILLSNCGFGSAREDLSEMIYEVFFGEDAAPSDRLTMDGNYIAH